MDTKIIELAKELIAIPSVTGDIKHANEILQIAKSQLLDYEFTPFEYRKNPSLLFSNQNKNNKNYKIILNAHLDVQPAEKEQFKPFEKDGKLYGRGAYDMKSAAAVMILLFKELAHEVHFPLALQLTTDEETDMPDTKNIPNNGTAYQIDQGVRGEFIIIGECNSNFKVGNQAKGRKLLKISTKGKKSHSAYAWLGENAIWRMYEVLEKIVKAYPIAREETFDTTVNVIKIETDNQATTVIPDNCTALLDIRFNAKDADSIVKSITSLLPKDVEVEVQHIRPAHFTSPDNSYISLLKSMTKKVHGKDLPLRFAHGSADVVFFSAVDCDAIEFGPIGDGAHHDNEWVDIKSLEEYYQILKNFLLEVDQLS